ncbi:MFS transporter, partial [Neoroseomonas rubea]|uniref:MFS transporter n=1 Tax=Neoroseomonas rubea TaxID=2748666 RepID=UPI0018DF9C75
RGAARARHLGDTPHAPGQHPASRALEERDISRALSERDTPRALSERDTPRALSERDALFPGWRVVAGAFLVCMVGFGAIYSCAAFAEDLAASFGASRTSASLILALSGASCFLVSGLTGPLADRVGPRALAVAGMATVALGLVTAANAQSMAEVLLCYGVLIGLGTGFAYVPAMAAVQRWFVAARGLASGIAAAGVGFGTALVPPMAALLRELGDWRLAFMVSGAAAAVVGITGALLLRPSPEAAGLRPDGAARAALPSGEVGERVLGTAGFRAFYVGTLLLSVPLALPFAHLVGSARDLGIPAGDALALLGAIGIGSIAGRFLIGAVADLAGRERVFIATSALAALSTMLWAAAEGRLALMVFATLFGAAYGGVIALLPAFAADVFGRRAAGTVIGVGYTGRGIALLAAPPAFALLAEAVGGHRAAVVIGAGLGLLGVALLLRAARR